jgi:hypothetical protein
LIILEKQFEEPRCDFYLGTEYPDAKLVLTKVPLESGSSIEKEYKTLENIGFHPNILQKMRICTETIQAN